MSPDNRGERLQIMLTASELVALDDFRFKNRMPSRAAAIRELLRRGLTAEGFSSAAFGRKSSDYGVTAEDQLEGIRLDGHGGNGRKPAK